MVGSSSEYALSTLVLPSFYLAFLRLVQLSSCQYWNVIHPPVLLVFIRSGHKNRFSKHHSIIIRPVDRATILIVLQYYHSSKENKTRNLKWECRAIAQAVSRRFPTAAARVLVRVRSCGICDGQSGTGEGFLRVLRFSLPIRIPPVAPQSSSSIIWGWYSRPNSGRSTKLTQSHTMRKIIQKLKWGNVRLFYLIQFFW
jgi:hypothetical protein